LNSKASPDGAADRERQIENATRAHKTEKSPQPPLLYSGAIPDSDRAKKPPLAEPSATDQELRPGDRVERLGNFGKPTGEFGTVSRLTKMAQS